MSGCRRAVVFLLRVGVYFNGQRELLAKALLIRLDLEENLQEAFLDGNADFLKDIRKEFEENPDTGPKCEDIEDGVVWKYKQIFASAAHVYHEYQNRAPVLDFHQNYYLWFLQHPNFQSSITVLMITRFIRNILVKGKYVIDQSYRLKNWPYFFQTVLGDFCVAEMFVYICIHAVALILATLSFVGFFAWCSKRAPSGHHKYRQQIYAYMKKAWNQLKNNRPRGSFHSEDYVDLYEFCHVMERAGEKHGIDRFQYPYSEPGYDHYKATHQHVDYTDTYHKRQVCNDCMYVPPDLENLK